MKVNTIADQLEVLTLQATNLPTYQTEVGATAAQITAVGQERLLLLYVVDFTEIVDNNKLGCTQIKQAIFNGDPNVAVSDFPVFLVANPPFPLIGGLKTLANKRRDLWRAAPGYTNEIGLLLGIGQSQKPSAPVGGYKPTVEVFGAQSGNMFSVVVGNRGDAVMWNVLAKEINDPAYAIVASGEGKSMDVTYPASTPSAPRQLQVRIQLKKANENYGQMSDIVLVTVNP